MGCTSTARALKGGGYTPKVCPKKNECMTDSTQLEFSAIIFACLIWYPLSGDAAVALALQTASFYLVL